MQLEKRLYSVRQGEHFILDGVEFVKLDETLLGAFVVTADVLPDVCPFESYDYDCEDANNFYSSYIAQEILRWLRDQHKPIFEATLEQPIDLTTMDGMTDYGTPLVVARLLTIDEYRKYRRFIPLASRPFWLATGWTTKSSPFAGAHTVYYVGTGGTVDGYGAYGTSFAPRPALHLKSSILTESGGCRNQGSPQYMCKCKPDTCNAVVTLARGDCIRSMDNESLGSSSVS